MFQPGRRRFLMAGVGLGAFLGAPAWDRGTGAATLATPWRRTSYALGTKVTITALHEDAAKARAALDAALDAIEHIEAVMSIYRPDSQLCRLNRNGVLDRPHPDLVSVLRSAILASEASHGAFDVTVQPLWEAFAKAQQQGRLPDDNQLAAAQACIGWQRLEIRHDRIRLHGAGTKITLNGIAQGFAADRALEVLQAHGVEHALIDAGELAGRGQNESGEAWQVGVQHPREPDAYVALAGLKDRCLSTSGDYSTTFTVDRKLNHVFDPQTGRSPTEVASVTIAAQRAVDADALSTACFVLGPARSQQLLQTMPKTDALFVLKDGRTLTTPGFPLVQKEVHS